STSSATIDFAGPSGNGKFNIQGSHTYGEEGTYTIQIIDLKHEGVLGAGGASQDASNITVNEAPITSLTAGTSAQTINEGSTITAISGIATFTDPAGAETTGDYTATINWGDGSTSLGTVNFVSGNDFSVDAPSHLYGEEGTYSVTVT